MAYLNGIAVIVWIYLITMTGDVVRGQSAGPNAVVLINGQTMLDCIIVPSLLTYSYWRRTTDGSSNLFVIADGCPVVTTDPEHYRTELIGNICRLTIGNATMELGGVYSCSDGDQTIFRSLVTVIDPVASVVVYNQSEVVENDELNISCSINYTGPSSPAPSLRPLPSWTTSSQGQDFTSIIYHPSINNATSVATVTVKRPTVPIFNCSTAFEVIEGSDPNYNMTAPQDTFMVGSTPHPLPDVQYPAENIRIVSTVSPVDNCIFKPETLTCTADANPPAQYRWTDINDNVLSTSSVLSITTGGQFQCIANNTIRNTIYNATMSNMTTNCNQPHNVTISGSSCANNTCSCAGNQTKITLNCAAEGNPTPTYQWYDGFGKPLASRSSSIEVDTDGNYSCTASNTFGNSEQHATAFMLVSSCQAPPIYNGSSSSNVITTTPNSNNNHTTPSPSPSKVGVAVGVAIGCFVAVNSAAMFAFLCFYAMAGNSNTNNSNGNVKKERNKTTLNKRFPFLQKMLPCMNDSKESTGSKVLWVTLFILLGVFTGIVTFPVFIILAMKSGSSNETSALTKRPNGDGESEGNGRISPEYPPDYQQDTPPSQTRTANQMRPRQGGDLYQNESRVNIELESSHRSKGYPTISPKPNAFPAGRPPPPPTKNRSGPVNDYPTRPPNPIVDPSTIYADLPVGKNYDIHPVQSFEGTEDNYAPLKKT